jgi:phosphoribosyl-ATP pyrophosphohydrolase/phosphoribosyl-AMP cyclohydrolase
VTFWSRSRNEVWEKGATSGNRLDLVAIDPDCDGDALLVTARPAGPACHTGATSCFDADPAGAGFVRLEDLWAVIAARAVERPDGSYTASLITGGTDAVARKVIEEAGEVVLAAKDHASGGPAARVEEEAADLIYHLLVLLAERGLGAGEVLDVLQRRAGEPGTAS